MRRQVRPALLLAWLLASVPLWLVIASDRALPIYRSLWFIAHTVSAALGAGALAVAGIIGILYLAALSAPSVASRLPALATLDAAAYMLLRLGFPWMTLSLVMGSIWAQLTWGTLWNWEMRETWALIAWLLFLLCQHVRDIPGWAGKRMAFVAAAALLITLLALASARFLYT